MVLSLRREDAQWWLQGPLAVSAVDEIGIAGVVGHPSPGGRRAVRQGLEGFDGGSVGEGVLAPLAAVEDPQQRPHTLMEVGVEVAVEDCVADHAIQTACAVQQIQRHTLLGADGYGVNNSGAGIG